MSGNDGGDGGAPGPTSSSLSLSLPVPIPLGAGALGRLAVAEERARRRAARDHQRRVKAQEQSLLPVLMQGAAAGAPPSAEEVRAEAARRPAPAPAFGPGGGGGAQTDLDGPVLSARRGGGGGRAPLRPAQRRAMQREHSGQRLAHRDDEGDGAALDDHDHAAAAAAAAAAAHPGGADAEVSRINRDGGLDLAEHKENGGDDEAQPDTASDHERDGDSDGQQGDADEERDGDSLAMEAALAAGMTASTRLPIGGESAAAAGRHRKAEARPRQQRGGNGPRRGAKHQQSQSSSSVALGHRGLGDESGSVSLSSLVQEGTRRSLIGRYQLSEEEKKISAYYSTIQSAASKVADSINALLPAEGEEDLDTLVERWGKQGLGADEIRIRLMHRAPGAVEGAAGKGDGAGAGDGGVALNEHDAYRKSFARLHQLLDGMSTSNLTVVGRGGGLGGSAFSEQQFREMQEEQERNEALQRQREEEEAEERARKEAEEAAATAAADAEAAADAVADSFQSPDVSDSSESSEDEEAALAAVRGGGGGGLGASKDRSGAPGSFPSHPSASGSSSSSAAPFHHHSSSHSPASVYRDLHTFFTGKRRTELIDSKRLHMLETQTAAVEEAGEATRVAVTETIKMKAQHTSSILQSYHKNLQITSRQMGPCVVGRRAGGHHSSSAARIAANAAADAKQRQAAAMQSADEIALQRIQLELVVATLQARVAEQDELLASIGVAEEEAAAVAAAHSSPDAHYTYVSNPHLVRSFESKASHLYKIVHDLQSTLRARQAERLALQEKVEQSQDAIARLLKYENQAAMEEREREENARREAELESKHAATTAELKRVTAAAEARFHEVATRNHAMSLTLQSVEAELGAMHALRESEASKTAVLRAKHRKECVSIMRGQIPKHLVGLMGRSHLAAARHHGSMSLSLPMDTGGLDHFEDPEQLPSQLALKDEEVEHLQLDASAMKLADWEAAEAAEAARLEALARPPPVALSPEEAAAQAAAAEADRIAAEEAALDARALTPISKLRRTVDKTYAQIGAQEMAYVPWQAELFLTLQPRYNSLVDDLAELQERLRAQQQHRRNWEVRQKEMADAEADAKRKDGGEDGDDQTGSDDDQSEYESDCSDDGGGGGGAAGKIKPKQYARRVHEKSYLADKPGAKKKKKGQEEEEEEEESEELREARLRMGHNSFISEQIRSFSVVQARSNQSLASHLHLLKNDHASLHAQVHSLMGKWEEMRAADQRVQRVNALQIQPTRRRIQTVRAHMARIEAAIEAKVKWNEAREEAERQKQAEEEKAAEGEGEHQTDGAAPDTSAAAGSQSPPTASTGLSGSARLSGTKARSRRPSVATLSSAGPDGTASRTASRSRRPSMAQSSLLGEGLLSSAGGSSVASSSGPGSASRPISHHGGRHSRNTSTGGSSGSSNRRSHRPSLKKDDLHHLASASMASPSTTSAPTPASPPPHAAASDATAAAAPLLDESSLLESNAQLAQEADALEEELARLELEQEALMSDHASEEEDDDDSEQRPNPALQWMLAQAQAASRADPGAPADASSVAGGGGGPAAAPSSSLALPSAAPFASLTPLQLGSMAIVSEAEAHASQPQQIVSAYEQLKADMALWKQNALLRSIQENKEAAAAAAAAAKVAASLPPESHSSDPTDADDPSIVDSAPASSLAASVSHALATQTTPRWAPGPAIVSITLPDDIQQPGPAAAAAVATGEKHAVEAQPSAAAPPKSTPLKATPLNIDATALLPSSASVTTAPAPPTKLHSRPALAPATVGLGASNAAAPSHSDAAAPTSTSPVHGSASGADAAAAVPSLGTSMPPTPSFAPLQVLGQPVVASVVLPLVDFANPSARGAQPKPLRLSLEKAAVPALTIVPAAAAHQSRQAALGGAMGDFVSSQQHPEPNPNAVAPPQMHSHRRRAAHARNDVVEKRLDALPPFSARSMSIAAQQQQQQQASLNEQSASARAPPKQRAGAGAGAAAVGLVRGVGVQGKKVQTTKQGSKENNGAVVPQTDADADATAAADSEAVEATPPSSAGGVAGESPRAASPRHPGLVAAPSDPSSSSSFQLTPLPFDSAHATVPEGEEDGTEDTTAAAMDEHAAAAAVAAEGEPVPVDLSSSAAVPLSMVLVDPLQQLPLVQTGDTALILGGGVGVPSGAPLSVTHKPIMGGGVHLASTAAGHQAASPTHAAGAPGLLVTAAPIKLQSKQAAQAAAVSKLATSVSAESLPGPSEQAAAAPSAASMRRAQSQSSLAPSFRGTLPMRTTNLGALIQQQPPAPSGELADGATRPLSSAPSSVFSPLGIPSFATPLPQSFQPKVAKKSVNQLLAEQEAATSAAAAGSLHASHSVAALPARDSSPTAASHPPQSLHRSSTLPPSMPLGAGLGPASSGPGGAQGSWSPERQRSLSPPPRRNAVGAPATEAPVVGAALAAPMLLSASASAGRLVAAPPGVSFASARDRADALAHSALLDQFSRILSSSELHTVTQHATRLRVQGAAGGAGTAGASGAVSERSATHGARSSPRRATTGPSGASTARLLERGGSPFGLDDASAAMVSSPAQLVADARRLQHASSTGSTRPQRSGRSRVPSHMQSMLSVRASIAATATASTSASASHAAHPPLLSSQEPALDASVAAYLMSLHAPQPPSAGAPAASPRKHKARNHA